MRGKWIMYIDQYGAKVWARTVAELRREAGGGRVCKLYHDKVDTTRRTFHIGYCVGRRWFTAYAPVELPA